MKSMKSLVWSVLWCSLILASNACKSSVPPTAIYLNSEGDANADEAVDAVINEINEGQEKLGKIKAEADSNDASSASIKKKLDEQTALLDSAEAMSEEQKKAIQKEIDALTAQINDLNAQNQALKEKQVALEKQVNDAKYSANVAATAGASGFPLCGSVYYGTRFNCNGKVCGKSDPQYVNICEITTASQAANGGQQAQGGVGSSGYPLCGATFYGSQFNCNGKTCAKSDPAYVNICEITAGGQAANGAGASGFPLCGGIYYGSVFNCNGRSCAKSDAQYKYICEIRSGSAPAGQVATAGGTGSSGYAYCPNPRYGTDFTCNNNRVCAKSDPNYVNICEVR